MLSICETDPAIAMTAFLFYYLATFYCFYRDDVG